MSLNYPKIKTPLPGPKAKVLLKKDSTYVSPSYTRSYPLVIAKGSGCQVEDVDGNRFLDMTAGIAVTATGHSHPEVVKAIQDQAEKFLHMSGTDFYYAPQAELAEELAKLTPGIAPKKVFFCNSGAEAIEGAIKLARYATKRSAIIAFQGAFHGRTYGALSLTASKTVQKQGFGPFLPGIYHVPYPNPKERAAAESPEDCTKASIDWIRRLFQGTVPPQEVAAIVVEPIQGEGGYIVPPKNFHKALKALCEEYGILYVADEVQTGVGRTGTFFAIEQFGVVPDIITIAKGIASGLPLGAIVSRADLMSWPPGSHASTFGGNPLSCVAALKTLALVKKSLMKNAKEQGAFFKTQLLQLQKRFPVITDVRGLGLMLAIEIEDVDLRNRLVDKAFYAGLLLLGCGKKAIRFSPALTLNREELTTAIEILTNVLLS